MGEAETIGRVRRPNTRQSVAEELRALGLRPGTLVLVHASLSRLGWVCGGPVAVVQALLDVVGPAGTVAMPTQSGDYTDPALWQEPPVPPAWVPVIRETMPAYDPLLTPTRGMGAIAETFRRWPGALRSAHPAVSFAALGPDAAAITDGHGLEYGLGERSPLARIYERDGSVLLLGVGYDQNTSFHLAEYRAPGTPERTDASPLLEDGLRVWREYRDLALDDEPFATIGAAFEATGAVRLGPVGAADARLFGQRAAVDFAERWLRDARGGVRGS